MQCECCGREKDVLIEIGAVSPKVSATGRCCADCCALILTALEDRREEQPPEKAELVPAREDQEFVDEDGNEILPEEIRFGMKDVAGKIHYFCVRSLEMLPETEVFEIYPKGTGRKDMAQSTAYRFRAFGFRKTEEERLVELLLKLNNALMNPMIETHRTGEKERPMEIQVLRPCGAVEIESTTDRGVRFRVDGKLFSPEEFAGMLEPYNSFLLTYQIRDSLIAELPDRDTCYLPVRVTEDLLLEELEQLIFTVSGGRSFLSYRDVGAFDFGFFTIYDKLKLYFESNPPGVGKLAGMKMIRRLEQLETDDDDFPNFQIGIIRDLIGEI